MLKTEKNHKFPPAQKTQWITAWIIMHSTVLFRGVVTLRIFSRDVVGWYLEVFWAWKTCRETNAFLIHYRQWTRWFSRNLCWKIDNGHTDKAANIVATSYKTWFNDNKRMNTGRDSWNERNPLTIILRDAGLAVLTFPCSAPTSIKSNLIHLQMPKLSTF